MPVSMFHDKPPARGAKHHGQCRELNTARVQGKRLLALLQSGPENIVQLGLSAG